MKQFKFLSNYTQVFEGRQEDKKIVDELSEMLKDSSAMNDIVALKPELPEGTGASIHEEPRGAKAIGPDRSYQITKSDKGFMISFKSNYGRSAYITLDQDYITLNEDGTFDIADDATFLFKTREQTASVFGDSQEQKDAATSFFRYLEIGDKKNKYSNLSIPLDIAGVGDNWRYDLTDKAGTKGIKSIKRIIKFAEKWNEKYGSFVGTNIEIPEPPSVNDTNDAKNAWRDEMLERLNDFKLAYNAKMTPIRDAAVAAGEKKVISVGSDFPIRMTFNNLEDCLRWVWAYFVARKTARDLDASKTFDYLMAKKEYWGAKMPLGERYGELNYSTDSLGSELVKIEGLRHTVATYIKDMGNVGYFIKSAYEELGLNIELIKKGHSAGGLYGRTEIAEDEIKKPTETVDFSEGNIGKFIISNILSTGNTVIGAATQIFTDKGVKFMPKDLIFELEKRSEFKYKYETREKVWSRISPNEIYVPMECRTQQELLQLLLFADTKKGPGILAGSKPPLLIQAFSTRKSVIVSEESGDVEKKNTHIIDLILDFTKQLKKHIEELVPGFSEKLGANFAIPKFANRKIILKCIAAAIESPNQAGTSGLMKQKIKEKNPTLYEELFPKETPATGAEKRGTIKGRLKKKDSDSN